MVAHLFRLDQGVVFLNVLAWIAPRQESVVMFAFCVRSLVGSVGFAWVVAWGGHEAGVVLVVVVVFVVMVVLFVE